MKHAFPGRFVYIGRGLLLWGWWGGKVIFHCHEAFLKTQVRARDQIYRLKRSPEASAAGWLIDVQRLKDIPPVDAKHQTPMPRRKHAARTPLLRVSSPTFL